jgi:DinB family protein
MNNDVLRENLVELLQGGHAHVTAEMALTNIKPENRVVRPTPAVRAIWEELEHLRIAQEDILRYTVDASWKSPPWPEGYWPASAEAVGEDVWSASIASFFADLEEIIDLIRNPDIDLTAEIPHGEGHTYLREVLLIADHNAYHLGQIVQIRKLLGNWPE